MLERIEFDDMNNIEILIAIRICSYPHLDTNSIEMGLKYEKKRKFYQSIVMLYVRMCGSEWWNCFMHGLRSTSWNSHHHCSSGYILVKLLNLQKNFFFFCCSFRKRDDGEEFTSICQCWWPFSFVNIIEVKKKQPKGLCAFSLGLTDDAKSKYSEYNLYFTQLFLTK